MRRFRVAGPAGDTLRLWEGFLGLHEQGDRPFAERAAAFEALCDDLRSGGAGSPEVRALAADLLVRSAVLRFVLSGMGPSRRGPLVSRLAGTASRYREAGDGSEAVAALRRAANFAADGLAADRATARELLVRASGEAAEDGLRCAQAQAELALAALDLRAVLDVDDQGELAGILRRFDEVTAAFQAGGHVFAEALVGWAVARILLVYANAAGLELARSSAEGFAAADAPSSELQVWSALRLWYTVDGDRDLGQDAETRAARLAALMGSAFATEMRALDEANQAFRDGDVATARSMLTGLARSSPGLHMGSRLMLATSASAVGMRAEARQLLEGVVAELTSTGASLLLGEALALLATQVMDSGDNRAVDLLKSAADVARAAEAPAEEARYRAQLGWTMVTQRMRAGTRPYLTSDADAEFAACERLLAAQRTLDAGTELVKLYQYRGQAAFFDSDWDQVGTWLTKAERVARALGFLPDLAFILSYQGLVMIQVARRSGPPSYDQAARLLGESQRLFQQAGLPAFEWQSGFYRALCDIEAARWPDSGSAPQRAVRLDRASRLMEESSDLVDQLRAASESGDAERRQQVWMAFSVDKQTFYTQGFWLAQGARSEAADAWRWLERMKSRALLDGLSDASRRPEDTGISGPDRRAVVRKSEPLDYAELRRLLTAEESAAAGKRVVLAAYLCTPERTLVFGARTDWDAPRTTDIQLDYPALKQFASMTFRQPGGVRMMMEDRGDGGLREWHRFAPLIEPLADWSGKDDVIYLVPYGLLHDLPLHTLPLGGEPLLERNAVCYAPAAAVLRHTLGGGSHQYAPSSASVFGDARGDLRFARQEAGAVAALLGVSAVTGDDVTRERVMHAFRHSAVLHFAGHGQLSTADGFASGLELAGADLIRAGDLLGQRCVTRLAALSGCDTGVSELRPGDEPVGLIRALLLSGVRSILASQWQVNDASTSDLICHFHQAARDSVPLAEALRQAARAIRRQPGRSHPYHWGSFALIGSWR